jgi:hypothetical protein
MYFGWGARLIWSVSPRMFWQGCRAVVTSWFSRLRRSAFDFDLEGLKVELCSPSVRAQPRLARSLPRGPGACLRKRGPILEWTVPSRSAKLCLGQVVLIV